MHRHLVGTAIWVALLPSLPLNADMCTVDPVPAATLLVPYFEAATTDPQGVDTVVTIHNATSEPTLVNVTFWTDYSLPSIWFNLYLTGYDVIRFDLKDLFRNGNLPITADLQSDPNDDISPSGGPAWDTSFEGCDNIFPFFVNPVVTGGNFERLVNAHTGQPVSSVAGRCLGSAVGDTVARGYITIDTVNRCALMAPSEQGYFGGSSPVASNRNALWGEFSIIDPANSFSFTDSLVHVEADLQFDATSTDSGYTFYGRFTKDQGGNDHREPLGTAWGARYVEEGAFEGTDFIVWRDSTWSSPPESIPCDEEPPWYPMNEASVECWNEEEELVSVCAPEIIGGEDPACFPLETQRVDSSSLSLPFDFGWCRLNLNTQDGFTGDVDFPTAGSPITQSYVMSASRSSGRYQVALPSVQLGHACDALTREIGHE